MSDKERGDGGPAFPCKTKTYNPPAFGELGHTFEHELPGMTLRDYFAAKAMAAIIWPWSEGSDNYFKPVADAAYLIADAMLAARERKT